MTFDLVRALRDHEYRENLTLQQRATLNLIELDDDATKSLTGGCGSIVTSPAESCITGIDMQCP